MFLGDYVSSSDICYGSLGRHHKMLDAGLHFIFLFHIVKLSIHIVLNVKFV